jgi:hypothetical protein
MKMNLRLFFTKPVTASPSRWVKSYRLNCLNFSKQPNVVGGTVLERCFVIEVFFLWILVEKTLGYNDWDNSWDDFSNNTSVNLSFIICQEYRVRKINTTSLCRSPFIELFWPNIRIKRGKHLLILTFLWNENRFFINLKNIKLFHVVYQQCDVDRRDHKNGLLLYVNNNFSLYLETVISRLIEMIGKHFGNPLKSNNSIIDLNNHTAEQRGVNTQFLVAEKIDMFVRIFSETFDLFYCIRAFLSYSCRDGTTEFITVNYLQFHFSLSAISNT